ncbi:hypothetical protein HHK36_007093 [Tetracentron sinense]|uniref:Ankyrin repeat domain-containing protein EMB506, chloroplastic n=1 Tax=Tetracentron sinense TaxID=13715 RepID=A0A835DLB0_TETSI|nr:hypothetical protein HHK36_007093 [Tetracentron sinense]
MIVSWGAVTFPSTPFLPLSAAAPSCSANLLKAYSNPRVKGRILISVSGNHSKSRICGVDSRRVSSLQPRQGTWEDPDDGSGSEYEDDDGDEEEEEDDLDFESDWEEERDASASATATNVNKSAITTTETHYEDDLVKEVERLLAPEERAILQQNEAPTKWSALHTLGLSGQTHFMDKLLDNGVDIDSIDKDGFTALHKAVIGKKEAVISHLLRKGANPHVRDRDGVTPLHYAVQVGAFQTVKLLIKCKVDVNVADDEGWTPLHIAMQGRSRDIAKVLLVNGADKTRRNKDGKTPLDLSLCYGKDFKSYELAKLLKLVPANRDL